MEIRQLDSISSAVNTIPSLIAATQTVYQLTGVGSVSAQIPQGGAFAICIQTPNVTAAAYSLASATTTLGSTLITMVSTSGAAIGQQVIGVGIQTGSFIVGINPNVSITISIPATASGTVTLTGTGGNFTAVLEASADGSNWVSDTCLPKTIIGQNAATSALNQIGLWQYEPSSIAYKFVRVRVTSVNSIPFINIFIDSVGVAGANINLPFVSGLTSSIPTGIACVPPIETSYLSELTVDIQLFTGTSQLLSTYQSNDPILAVLQTATYTPSTSTTVASGTTVSSVNSIKIVPNSKYFLVKLTHTAITALQIGGVSAKIGLSMGASMGQSTVAISSVSLSAAGGQGTSNKGINVAQASAIPLTAYSAQAWAAASGSGATLTNEYGTTAAYDINVTAWTVGTSTGLVVALQWSPDGTNNWVDQWITEPITAVGRVTIPALQVQGRVRMRWFHISGSATTATVTVTAMNTSIGNVPVQYQYFDRTAGVGSGNAVLNNVSASYWSAGARNFTVVMDAGTATTAGAFKAQMSMNGTSWYDASAATTIGALTANMTIIPITSGIIGRFIRIICTSAGSAQVINAIHICAVN